jgi:hypothetical protein
VNKPKLLESKKLHYKKYLYKLKLTNPLAGIFRTERQRGGKLEFAKARIEEFFDQHRNNQPIVSIRYRTQVSITYQEVLDANEIYKTMRSAATEYLLRCEYQTIIVYSNDKGLLVKLSKKIVTGDTELWEPDKSVVGFLSTNANTIMVDIPTDFPYKITFGRKPAKIELANWIDNNSDKVKIGNILLDNLRNEVRWIQGQYFYVKDEKVIFLLKIMLGDNIGKIDKLVYKGDIR